MVNKPEFAYIVLRDPHIVTGIDNKQHGSAAKPLGNVDVPSIVQFFELWYTVGDDYLAFSTELRKVFTTRVVEQFDRAFGDLADRQVAAMPPNGDLARDYFAPYLMHSTFHLIGVPEPEWPNLAKAARVVIYLFKQRLLGTTEHPDRELAAFAAVMRYLRSLTHALLAADTATPFLHAARRLATRSPGVWTVAALIGQLLMAGIEPMILGACVAYLRLYDEPALLDEVRAGILDVAGAVEEAMRACPPFGNIFRFVREPCTCLGVPLSAGTVIAVDVAAVNLAIAPPRAIADGCPVGQGSVWTFGKGVHYCLGANSARLQVSTAIRRLVTGRPALRIDRAGVRIDAHNNLKEVRSLPYLTG